ncbi:hypothetical protein SEVIR_7G304400v4 [Setaria viridis]
MTAAGMGSDGRLRRALAAFGGGGDVWDLVDAALTAAARDNPDELRARRDGIVERLYAGARCHNCDAGAPSPPQPRKAPEAAAAAEAVSPVSPDEEVDADGLGEDDDDAGVESKILAIRDFLEDPDQSEDEMVSLLQNLADMDITYKALQETDIGRHVNGLRKHPSGEVRQLVKLLVRKWKEIVDDWVMVTHLIKSNPRTIKVLRLQTSSIPLAHRVIMVSAQRGLSIKIRWSQQWRSEEQALHLLTITPSRTTIATILLLHHQF